MDEIRPSQRAQNRAVLPHASIHCHQKGSAPGSSKLPHAPRASSHLEYCGASGAVNALTRALVFS